MPAWETSLGDHEASGTETSREATSGGTNENVVNNVCVGCPDGRTSSGDHDAAGIDTLRDATSCDEGESGEHDVHSGPSREDSRAST